MMDVFLKYVSILPLTKPAVAAFLEFAADMGSRGLISLDDWKYLAMLVMFRIDKYVLSPRREAANE